MLARRSHMTAALVVSLALAAQGAAFGSPIPSYTITDLGETGWLAPGIYDKDAGTVRNVAGDQTYIFRSAQSVSIPSAQFSSLVQSNSQLRGLDLGYEAWQNPLAPEYAVFKMNHMGSWGPNGPIYVPRSERYSSFFEARRGASGDWELIGEVGRGFNGNIELRGISQKGQVLALYDTGRGGGLVGITRSSSSMTLLPGLP